MIVIKKNVLLRQYIECIFGCFLYSLSFNYFILPHKLFSSGFVGLSQLLHYFLSQLFNLPEMGDNTISILYLALNIPLFFLLYKTMRVSYVLKTIVTVVIQSMFMYILPVPTQLIVSDRLTAVVTSGILSGVALGIIVRAAASSGGSDIISMYIAKRSPTLGMGMVSLYINLCIYTISSLLFGIETGIYSAIYSIICSMLVDRFHLQNIGTAAIIITHKHDMCDIIMEAINRGSTVWDAKGAYTRANTQVILTCISKYEKRILTRIVKNHDPQAFIIYTDQAEIRGNFIKRFDD